MSHSHQGVCRSRLAARGHANGTRVEWRNLRRGQGRTHFGMAAVDRRGRCVNVEHGEGGSHARLSPSRPERHRDLDVRLTVAYALTSHVVGGDVYLPRIGEGALLAGAKPRRRRHRARARAGRRNRGTDGMDEGTSRPDVGVLDDAVLRPHIAAPGDRCAAPCAHRVGGRRRNDR